MAPPDKDTAGLEDLFPGLFPQRPAIDPTDPSTWPLPSAAPSGGGGGAGSVLARRDEIRRVADEMRKDLATLKTALATLQGQQHGQVGAWDVAQQFGSQLGAAHAGMITAVQAYCSAYEACVSKLDQTVKNLSKAEELATRTTKNAGTDAPPTGVRPWQDQ